MPSARPVVVKPTEPLRGRERLDVEGDVRLAHEVVVDLREVGDALGLPRPDGGLTLRHGPVSVSLSQWVTLCDMEAAVSKPL